MIRRYEQHAVQAEVPCRLTRNRKVPLVNRVERPAEDRQSQSSCLKLDSSSSVVPPWRTHSCVPRRHSCRRLAELGGLVRGRRPRLPARVFYTRSIFTEFTRTSFTGRSCAPRGTCEIFSTTSYPSVTSPKTLCLLSSQGVAASVMKNWLPLVFGPALAIDRVPALVCFRSLWNSSANLYPGPPRPVPSGSPPWIMKPGITRWKIVPSSSGFPVLPPSATLT